MTLLEKFFCCTLSAAILAIGVLAYSLTDIHGSVTISFGKQPDSVTMLASVITKMGVTR